MTMITSFIKRRRRKKKEGVCSLGRVMKSTRRRRRRRQGTSNTQVPDAVKSPTQLKFRRLHFHIFFVWSHLENNIMNFKRKWGYIKSKNIVVKVKGAFFLWIFATSKVLHTLVCHSSGTFIAPPASSLTGLIPIPPLPHRGALLGGGGTAATASISTLKKDSRRLWRWRWPRQRPSSSWED